MRLPVFSRYAIKPCQTVGTPAANVTCSDSISDCSVSGSPIFGPGNTSFAPTIAQP